MGRKVSLKIYASIKVNKWTIQVAVIKTEIKNTVVMEEAHTSTPKMEFNEVWRKKDNKVDSDYDIHLKISGTVDILSLVVNNTTFSH